MVDPGAAKGAVPGVWGINFRRRAAKRRYAVYALFQPEQSITTADRIDHPLLEGGSEEREVCFYVGVLARNLLFRNR